MVLNNLYESFSNHRMTTTRRVNLMKYLLSRYSDRSIESSSMLPIDIARHWLTIQTVAHAMHSTSDTAAARVKSFRRIT